MILTSNTIYTGPLRSNWNEFDSVLLTIFTRSVWSRLPNNHRLVEICLECRRGEGHGSETGMHIKTQRRSGKRGEMLAHELRVC